MIYPARGFDPGGGLRARQFHPGRQGPTGPLVGDPRHRLVAPHERCQGNASPPEIFVFTNRCYFERKRLQLGFMFRMETLGSSNIDALICSRICFTP
jgi:hypothetical protein